MATTHLMLIKLFPTFMTLFKNVLVNKLKRVSNRMRKQFSKPWITSGLKKSIKVKNSLLQVLQKRVLRLMYFFEPRAHAVSLFITSNILPINMPYVETVSSLMYDVSRLSVPSNISDLFTKVSKIHTHKTRSSSSGNFYITLRVSAYTKSFLPDLELNSGIPSRTNFDNSLKVPLKSMYIICCF